MADSALLHVVQGAGFTVAFTTSAFGDMSAWTARMQIRITSGGRILYDGSTANGKIVITHDAAAVPPTSTVTVTLHGSDTLALPPDSNLVYDCMVTPPGGDPIRISGTKVGSVSVSSAVTVPALP